MDEKDISVQVAEICADDAEPKPRTEEVLALASSSTPDERRRLINIVVVEHMQLAETLARRFRRAGDDEDLRQVAMVGLVKAVQGFDPGRGAPFIPYAIPTIQGELKRHLRDHGWLVRPGRRLQELCQQVQERRSALLQSLGREPDETELADAMGVPVEDVRGAKACLQAQHAVEVVTADDADERDSTPVAGEAGQAVHLADLRLTLATVMKDLDPREAYILRRRFVDERTQAEIGREIGVTQMQVSRLLGQILARLRGRLSEQGNSLQSLLEAA